MSLKTLAKVESDFCEDVSPHTPIGHFRAFGAHGDMGVSDARIPRSCLASLRKAAVAIALAGLSSAPSLAVDLVFPDRGRAAVVDAAHVIPAEQADALDRRIVAWDRATGHQLAVATVPSLQGREIADYGYQLGRAWGLGRKGIDDGILLLIAPAEHKVRIDVGRGLEGDLTDAQTSVILSGVVVPKLQAGDIGGAAIAGVDAIMDAVPADAGDLANAPRPSHGSAFGIILMMIGALSVGAILVASWRMLRRIRRAAKAERDRFAAMRQRHDEMRERVEAEIVSGARPTMRRSTPPRYVSPLPPFTGKAEAPPKPSSPPRRSEERSSPTVVPVIIPEATYSPPAPDTSSSWGSSDSGSSSSSDSGSSGFDSGGGSFSGGGSDSSW